MIPIDTPEGKSKTGGFFQIDRRVWPLVCQLGLKEAVAYLVLARGTGSDNATTAWSVHSIEKYTSISRTRAKAAVDNLINAGFIRKVTDGTMPRYTILPAHEVPGTGVNALKARNPMTNGQQCVFEKVKRGGYLNGGEFNSAYALVRHGWLAGDGDRRFCVRDDDVAKPPQPEWIWLPNELVDGAVGEVPPVELIRGPQDVMTLRLFIELYDAQNLVENGGVYHRIIRQPYERVKVGQRGQYTVWGFSKRGLTAWKTGPVAPHIDGNKQGPEATRKLWDETSEYFWSRLRSLESTGLIEWVGHLFESDDPDAEIIHPFGTGRTDSLEDQLGAAAHRAGQAMVTDGQYDWATNKLGLSLCLVPVPHHYTNVQMIGVARLRYRPKTKKTASWWAEHQQNCLEYLTRYQELEEGNPSEMNKQFQ